jgi:carboxymethylenebutenolidase
MEQRNFQKMTGTNPRKLRRQLGSQNSVSNRSVDVPVKGHEIEFSNGSQEIKGYLARPASGTGPGVIVIQEWWGLVPHIKEVCDRFAAEGFNALAPDLYHGKTADEPDEAATLMQALHIGETEAILRKAILVLLADHGTTPNDKVGIIGFCMGGQLALFAAANNPVIKATVTFYGIHPAVQPNYRDLNGPVRGFYAERDNYASPTAVNALDEELTVFGKDHVFTTYPDTDHAFFNDTRPEVYNKEAAEDAWSKTISFFKETLPPA